MNISTKYSDKKHQNFKRVLSKRLDKTLKMIELIGNCSNTTNYSYSQNEIDLVFKALTKKLKETKGLYDARLGDKETKIF